MNEEASTIRRYICSYFVRIRARAGTQRQECGAELVRRRNNFFEQDLYDRLTSIVDAD